MALTEQDSFAAAEHLWKSGDTKAAAAAHIDLSRNAQSLELRLRSALVLIERLNPGRNVDMILEACSTGMEMAEKLSETATRAYLMGMRAKNLAILNGSLIIARKNLRLAPGWVGFSLERDEEQYKSLTARIDANDQEINRLARDAQKQCADQTTLGHVLLSLGNISIQRYMNLKSDCLQMSVRLPSFVLERLRLSTLDEYLWYSAPDRRAMRNHLKECESRYSEAVAAFRAAGDELNAGYAFYAVANDLRTAKRFRKANGYLTQAETIAKQHNDQTLLNRIPALKERIRQRNRNVPNYAAGEGKNGPIEFVQS